MFFLHVQTRELYANLLANRNLICYLEFQSRQIDLKYSVTYPQIHVNSTVESIMRWP